MAVNQSEPQHYAAQKFHFLLADDDMDDRFFFEKAIAMISPRTRVSFVEDGERLMDFLQSNKEKLPDVLFLDVNMPRKNGAECLKEIRANPIYNQMAIIIYSTGSHEGVADILYNNGAHYYIRKPDLAGLSKVLQHVVNLLIKKLLTRPDRERFVLEFV